MFFRFILMLFFLGESHLHSADLKVNDPAMISIQEHQVTIEWTTSEPSKSWIEYGESEKLGLKKESSEVSDGHTVTILNLKPKTSYFFKIVVQDKKGKETKTDFYTFHTESVEVQDTTTLKMISPPEATVVSSYKTIIGWTTNKPSASTIIYGIKGLKPKTVTSDLSVSEHMLTLENLSPHSRYFYQVIATDDQGNEVKSSYTSFVTTLKQKGKEPPFILEGPSIAVRTFDRVKVEWASDRPCQSFITWGKVPLPSFHKKMDVSQGFTTLHTFELPSLAPKTRYFYVIHSLDRNNLKSSSEIYSFQTNAIE